MARPKTLPDIEVLAAAHRLLHERGPDGLTFASLARACGLSASTLVQRFGSKDGLVQGALLHAWDRLDDKTAGLAAAVPRTPDGAVDMLLGLSQDYGGIETYADGLLILREDLRDPILRARGAAWKATLTAVLEDCFACTPAVPRGLGLLIAAQWLGSLLWWSFDPSVDVERFVEDNLKRFVAAICTVGPAGGHRSLSSIGQ